MLNSIKPPLDSISDFIRLESFGGILLFFSDGYGYAGGKFSSGSIYNALLDTTVVVQVDAFNITKPLLLWINDCPIFIKNSRQVVRNSNSIACLSDMLESTLQAI
jgi:Na+/H+ antiporter NhaA